MILIHHKDNSSGLSLNKERERAVLTRIKLQNIFSLEDIVGPDEITFSAKPGSVNIKVPGVFLLPASLRVGKVKLQS